MSNSIRLSLLVAAAGLVLSACGGSTSEQERVSFASYDKDYSTKPDFARVEHEFPLSRRQLASLTPENLATMSQEQVDQIYARLTAGPIPDGAFNGALFFADGGGARRIAEIVGGLQGKAVDLKLNLADFIGERLWKGKVFDSDSRVLRNMISERRYLESLFNLDPDSIPKATVPNHRSWMLFPKEAWLLFPAKLYCGQSLLDGRRESIVIDYAFNDDIEGYQENIDSLVGRNGLYIRDEIRMIRPGFYLGRAYLGHAFALNFTLYNNDIADAGLDAFLSGSELAQDCFTGTQARTVVASAGDR